MVSICGVSCNTIGEEEDSCQKNCSEMLGLFGEYLKSWKARQSSPAVLSAIVVNRLEFQKSDILFRGCDLLGASKVSDILWIGEVHWGLPLQGPEQHSHGLDTYEEKALSTQPTAASEIALLIHTLLNFCSLHASTGGFCALWEEMKASECFKNAADAIWEHN